MTQVFISYQRASEVAARRVAKRLAELGWEVWSDADLPPDRAYADTIREKLEAAKAVVVLWSELAAQSEWVRAEADFARQQRKLVQVTLDGSVPPMPFNQIQCANLSPWSRTEWAKVAASITAIAGHKDAPPANAPQRLSDVSKHAYPRTAWLAVGALCLLALVGAALWGLHILPARASSQADRIAILPFSVESQAPAARYFADGLTDQIQGALTNLQIPVVARSDAASLQSADRDAQIAKLKVRLLFNGTVQDDGKTTEVTVHLDDTGDHVTLWSGHYTGPSSAPDALQAHIGAVILGVLTCSARALRPGDGLSDIEALTQYLVACDRFAQQGENDAQMTDQMLTALRQVISRAPSFAPAHSALAKFLAYYAAVVPPDQAAAYRAEARPEAEKALQLDPKDADAYVALELLEPATNWAQREALLRKGVMAGPDWPHANGFLGMLLYEVGRTNEAITYTRKAAASDPTGESWASVNVRMLAGAGQTQEAEAAAVQLIKSWPDSTGDWYARLVAHMSSDNWDQAQANLNEPVASVVLPKPTLDVLRGFLVAAKSRNPDDVAKARVAAIDLAKPGGASLTAAITQLAVLGDLDDAFRLAQGYQPGLALTGANSEFLFVTETAPLRRDPRFMQLAGRIGLLGYWRTTGKWPDFCGDPTLPYRCQ